ncbi:Mth938-like domain-containing protein [Nisaea acidiphila]|uniref:Mth938-like domain-containing protein n=1 Tax=Nisaea acidiphila TaxID=1862145 RepID=A0A9J7ATC7_9PROT|nr:Mth938-like domain-containing protein [Nisaea acidiphila]UUX50106.1 Mth938-like domain-containing protein [Nisaea acidiphila]
MDVTPLIPEGRQLIEAYGDGAFRITGERYAGPVIVFPEETLDWNPAEVADLTLADFVPVTGREPAPEILLFGTGARTEFVLPSLRASIREKGPVVDIMDTGAACRTYNVLLAEGRRVAAALLPVD